MASAFRSVRPMSSRPSRRRWRVNSSSGKVLSMPAAGAETVPPERARPDVLRDHLKVEIERWVPIIRKAGVLAQ